MTAEEIVEKLRAQLTHLRRRYGVKAISLYGDFAKGKGKDNGYVDLLVDLDRELGLDFVTLTDELTRIVGHKVDLISTSGIDPAYKRELSKELIPA